MNLMFVTVYYYSANITLETVQHEFLGIILDLIKVAQQVPFESILFFNYRQKVFKTFY